MRAGPVPLTTCTPLNPDWGLNPQTPGSRARNRLWAFPLAAVPTQPPGPSLLLCFPPLRGD